MMKVKRLTTALVIQRAKPGVSFWKQKSLELNLFFTKAHEQRVVRDNVVKSPLIQFKRRGIVSNPVVLVKRLCLVREIMERSVMQ